MPATAPPTSSGRQRRPVNKDVNLGAEKPARRVVAPQPDAASDKSEDTSVAAEPAAKHVGERDSTVVHHLGDHHRVAPSRGKATKERGNAKPGGAKGAAAMVGDAESSPPHAGAPGSKASKPAKVTAKKQAKQAPASELVEAPRQRPTNNQLLYKARFNWEHYTHVLPVGARLELPSETHACASVTSAFLQVLKAIHTAEMHREYGSRNILKLLSVNTRRTKVVALNTGTHRVPDELRRHQLSDEDGNEYSTNLDRNRYGNDDQYLFTVIKFNLEALGLCPLICQVEIIDAKAKAEDCLVVKVAEEGCACHGATSHGRATGRVVLGGSSSHHGHKTAAAAANTAGLPGGAPTGGHGSDRPAKAAAVQWRVPTTPMSPLKRSVSAGDAGGMGMLLDALTQVGGMPPPSPLHLASSPGPCSGVLRRQSYLASSTAVAAASPSMRAASAAMSALCTSAPPSADRQTDRPPTEGGGGDGARTAAGLEYLGLSLNTPAAQQLAALQRHHGPQQLLFQSPPLYGATAARDLTSALTTAAQQQPAAAAAVAELEANRTALEALVERVSGEAAAARAAEAKGAATIARLERELAEARRGKDVTVTVPAAEGESETNSANAAAAARLVALEEEVAAFGARASSAAASSVGGSSRAEVMTALYVAEARAHARALARVARLEAALLGASSGGGVDADVAADVARGTRGGNETKRETEGPASQPGSPSAVAAIASEAAAAVAVKRRIDDDAAFLEPPPAKRSALGPLAVNSAAAVPAGYAPPTTPALADASNRDGILSPPGETVQALSFSHAVGQNA